MVKKKTKRGVSRDEWLRAALDELGSGRATELSVQELARKLGISKSGFYWHFTDKKALYKAVLEYWKHELTEVVTANPKIMELPPEERLLRTAQTVMDYDLAGYDVGIRQWALKDSQAARAARQVNTMRLDFVRTAFTELGFSGDELEMRTMLFVCYQTWELHMFRELPKKRLRALIKKRIRLLCRQ